MIEWCPRAVKSTWNRIYWILFHNMSFHWINLNEKKTPIKGKYLIIIDKKPMTNERYIDCYFSPGKNWFNLLDFDQSHVGTNKPMPTFSEKCDKYQIFRIHNLKTCIGLSIVTTGTCNIIVMTCIFSLSNLIALTFVEKCHHWYEYLHVNNHQDVTLFREMYHVHWLMEKDVLSFYALWYNCILQRKKWNNVVSNLLIIQMNCNKQTDSVIRCLEKVSMSCLGVFK